MTLGQEFSTYAVMLGEDVPRPGDASLPTKLVVAVDAFGFADADTTEALKPLVQRLASFVGSSSDVTMAPQGLSVWARAQDPRRKMR